jgi:hypothetical protein
MNGIIQPSAGAAIGVAALAPRLRRARPVAADLDLARQVSQMPHYSSILDYDHRRRGCARPSGHGNTNDRAPVSGALMYVKDDGVSPKLVCASECNRPGRKILGRVVGRYRVPEEVPFNLPGDA